MIGTDVPPLICLTAIASLASMIAIRLKSEISLLIAINTFNVNINSDCYSIKQLFLILSWISYSIIAELMN